MVHEILMPKLSSTMTEGTLTVWLKKVGEPVAVGEGIFEVMTDKIAIEVEAYEEGVLLKQLIGAGEEAPVNAVVGYIGEAGEQLPEVGKGEKNAVVEAVLQAEELAFSETDTAPELSNGREGIRATPAARRLAREKGVALTSLRGSGPRGRIQAQDVLRFQGLKPAVAELGKMPAETESNLVPWGGIRKAIADKMLASHTQIPAVTMSATVDMRQMIAMRKELLPLVEEEVQGRLSYTELVIKAVTVALRQFPQLNAYATVAGVKQMEAINVGIAVALPEGLVVPVLHQAEKLGLSALTKKVKEVTQAARLGTLKAEQLSGGTFTVSSLGKSRVTHFTPMINAPEVGILGVGGLYEQVQLDSEVGTMVSVPTLPLSLTFDHRVIDGAPAAAFLSLVVGLLEEPMRLLL